MSNSKDSVSNLLLIKRAKRRLVGAIIILIILFSLSIFFVKTKTEAIKSNPKISFLEITQQFSTSRKILIEEVSSSKQPKMERDVDQRSLKKKGFTVQLGIFSDEINMNKVKDQVNSMGYKTNTQAIKMDDGVKIRLTTEFFSNEKQARVILQEIKKANLPGFIRKLP
ncbi:SPOR domain-containing protein [Methylophilaceae bacterium]|nr:SPOR domain-containing protein [Methylophilaceae bacterium]|tara:strand:- start:151 stop:654 length:504 start_codon:yes stop_codon:yes gene_type:complete